MFSVRNVVVVAMMQVGVIVAGILGAGIWHKIQAEGGFRIPVVTVLLYEYGVFGFSIPIVWSVVTLVLNSREKISERMIFLAFWFGVVVLLALTSFFICTDFFPFFRTMWHLAD